MIDTIDSTVAETLDVPPFLQRKPSGGITPATVQAPTIVLPNGSRLDVIAAEVRQLHGDVHDGLRRTLPQAIRIGELLGEAKTKIPHGRWLDWMGEHCGFGERDAQRYMRLAKHRKEIEANTTPVSYLGVKSATKAIAKVARNSAGAPTSILPDSAFEQPEALIARRQRQLSELEAAWERADSAVQQTFLRRINAECATEWAVDG